jgi:hypothetical protein
MRAQATAAEGIGKFRDGFEFFTRGIRLLGSDMSTAGRLFYRAAAGASLKPREVCGLSPHTVVHLENIQVPLFFMCMWHMIRFCLSRTFSPANSCCEAAQGVQHNWPHLLFFLFQVCPFMYHVVSS